MIKILIVEDDPMVAMIHRRYLENLGYTDILGPVTTEEEVLSILEKEAVNLILLDVYLPKESGIEILKTIREKQYLQYVIMITAANTVEELKKAFSYGVVDYLVKPFEADRFEEAINKYKTRHSIFNKKDVISQEDIDNTFIKDSDMTITLPKGLNERTLKKVVEFLRERPQRVWTLREIAYELKISNVTIKKYMDYLEETNKVNVTLTSGNIGRPEHKYTFNLEI
ncbi:two-component system, CitB family, response regulator [Clostridium cavendishii DSM 21758]|uniref:Transcriptional regulatory protein n=1 Tax=Clostridium cavendishii DSM 21758 TaxID=1121302 RepID=A0A1M6RWF1_9CLOT|nr:response regulator [Clostridium cavendishii]SHK36822.1 two-component system, CitB family, response regulator [Clostridium cavendishii DSM 21758]